MNLENIFHTYNESEFEQHALQLFQYQYNNNKIYHQYCNAVNKKPIGVNTINNIPFLPISFFKTHRVITTDFVPETEFWSSGTTTGETSKHYVKNLSFYEQTFLSAFNHFYGKNDDYCFLALLPNYMLQKNSSLLYMMKTFINLSKFAESGFYLDNYLELFNQLQHLKSKKIKTILFGVPYAFLDFAKQFQIEFPDLLVFETGGMKGKRPEMVKEELHQILCKAFGVSNIHSEYGMCELLSQAYSTGNNLFTTPPWMKLLLRDEKDPFFYNETLDSGVTNVIDFANINTCAFIATDDLGKKGENGKMEILGRLDNAQVRGCNLLIY